MLSTAQVNQWHERGWTTIQIDVDEAADAAKELLPDSKEDTEFGSPDRIGEFPTGISALDDMVARPEIVNSVKQLLHAFDIRLLQADVWGKYKGIDQRIHQDYGNNTLLLPKWETPEAVAVIVYYDNFKGGETHVVSREGENDPAYRDGPARVAPGYHLPFENDRKAAEALIRRVEPRLAEFRDTLYAREVAVPYTKGTVLFYRHDLWHRGTPTFGTRRVHSLGYVKANTPGWTCWNSGFARKSYYSVVEDLIRRWTPEQRTLLNIPVHLTDVVEKRYKFPYARL